MLWCTSDDFNFILIGMPLRTGAVIVFHCVAAVEWNSLAARAKGFRESSLFILFLYLLVWRTARQLTWIRCSCQTDRCFAVWAQCDTIEGRKLCAVNLITLSLFQSSNGIGTCVCCVKIYVCVYACIYVCICIHGIKVQVI